jgi:hypothetical protein
LFTFFTISEHSPAGGSIPEELKQSVVVLTVLRQLPGEITQAGMVISLVYPQKYAMSLNTDEEQSATFVHLTATLKESALGKVNEVEAI